MSNEAIRVGRRARTMLVELEKGSDFVATFRLRGGWPTGAAVKIVFNETTTWNAAMTTEAASFNVPKEQADLIPEGAKAAWVVTNGSATQVFARGRVVRGD